MRRKVKKNRKLELALKLISMLTALLNLATVLMKFIDKLTE